MTSPLFNIIARLAAARPLSIAQYMELALQHPDYGYYRNRAMIGAQGDFITAPEISQIFGELIGLWCIDWWQKIGSPADFTLCEFGPGRGTMLRDALRAAHVAPEFSRACRLLLLENNPALRAIQSETLVTYNPQWIEALDDLTPMPTIILANEFFDALPIRQLRHSPEGWREYCVGFEDGALRLVLTPPDPALLHLLTPAQAALPTGAIVEMSPAAQTIMRQATRHIAAYGGAMLIIDYGYATPTGAPSFQALAKHRHTDPLAAPGEADLTAHVDFGILAAAARQEKLHAWPLLTQGGFLQRLGIAQRYDRLAAQATPEQRTELAASCRRLTEPEQMGSLFKSLCLTPSEYPVPAGWE